jgi:hypothetical protein
MTNKQHLKRFVIVFRFVFSVDVQLDDRVRVAERHEVQLGPRHQHRRLRITLRRLVHRELGKC